MYEKLKKLLKELSSEIENGFAGSWDQYQSIEKNQRVRYKKPYANRFLG